MGAAQIAEMNATIRRQLRTAQRILVISHIRPDGDAVGALLGLGLALTQNNKTVRMVLADGVPHNLRFLEGSKMIQHTAGGSGSTVEPSSYDYVIVLDCSDLLRVGPVRGRSWQARTSPCGRHPALSPKP